MSTAPTKDASRYRASFQNVDREAIIGDMTASLIVSFGDRAMLVARGQPLTADVGRESGVCWAEIVTALAQPVVVPQGLPYAKEP